MFVVITTSFIALFLTFLTSRGRLKYGLEFGFIALIVVQAIHFEYGPDYVNYELIFEKYSSEPLFSPISTDDFKDPGWVIMCRLFNPVGFFGMVAILSVVQNLIYYILVKKYVPTQWYWLSMFVYVFTTSIFLMNLSMQRQGFVVSVFMAIIPCIIKKKWEIALPIVILLSTIHASATLLIPFVFWGYIKIKSGITISIIYGLLFLIFLVGGVVVETLLSYTFSIGELSRYGEEETKGLSFGLGFLGDLIPFILTLIFLSNKNESEDNKKKIALLGIGSLLIPFQQYLIMVGRIGFYFSSIGVFSLYLMYDCILNKTLKYFFITIYLALAIYRYNLFFNIGSFAESYGQEFRTIFEVPWR